MATTRLVFGAGYLGKRAVALWQAAGDAVTVVTRSTESAAQWEAAGVSAIVANVTDAAGLNAAVTAAGIKPQTVLYAVGYDRSSNEDRQAVAVEGPRNAIAAVDHPAAHWVFTSSTSVYGQTDGSWVSEESPTEPPAENGQRCLAAEQLVQSMLSHRVTVMRLAGLYGPGRVLAKRETLSEQTPLPGDGHQWLNLIHADDAAAACVAAAERQYAGIILVADEQPVQRVDYYSALAQHFDTPSPVFSGQSRQQRGASNKRCATERLREQLLLTLSFPTYLQGLQHALS